MTDIGPVQHFEKLSRIWSRMRGAQVAVRIQYDVWQHRGCRIYLLNQVDVLEEVEVLD